jgi:hypothetical protein
VEINPFLGVVLNMIIHNRVCLVRATQMQVCFSAQVKHLAVIIANQRNNNKNKEYELLFLISDNFYFNECLLLKFRL